MAGPEFCGGSLIAPRWVLTAAHCTDGKTASDIDVVLGRTNLLTGTDGERISVSAIYQYPDYVGEADNYDKDISLLYLSSASSQDTITIVGSNDPNSHKAAGTTATVMGWGDTDPDDNASSYPSSLMAVDVAMISDTTLASYYSGYNVTDNMFGAGYAEGGKDSCQGDSGGPLVVEDTSSQDILVGAVSWGVGCAQPNQPGVYTDIAEYTSWISGYATDAEFETSRNVLYEIPYMNNSSDYKTFLKMTNDSSQSVSLGAYILTEDGDTYTLDDVATIASKETLLLNGDVLLPAATYGASVDYAAKLFIATTAVGADELFPTSVMKTDAGQRVIPVYHADASSSTTTTTFISPYINTSDAYSTTIKLNNWSDTSASVAVTLVSSDASTTATGSFTVSAGSTKTYDAATLAQEMNFDNTTYKHFSMKLVVTGPQADDLYALVFQDSRSGDRVIPIFRNTSTTSAGYDYF